MKHKVSEFIPQKINYPLKMKTCINLIPNVSTAGGGVQRVCVGAVETDTHFTKITTDSILFDYLPHYVSVLL